MCIRVNICVSPGTWVRTNKCSWRPLVRDPTGLQHVYSVNKAWKPSFFSEATALIPVLLLVSRNKHDLSTNGWHGKEDLASGCGFYFFYYLCVIYFWHRIRDVSLNNMYLQPIGVTVGRHHFWNVGENSTNVSDWQLKTIYFSSIKRIVNRR